VKADAEIEIFSDLNKEYKTHFIDPAKYKFSITYFSASNRTTKPNAFHKQGSFEVRLKILQYAVPPSSSTAHVA
jgi:hypothetical protein